MSELERMPMEQRVRRACVRQNLFGRWYLASAEYPTLLAWTGSRWTLHADGMPIGGIQICNFETADKARAYAGEMGLTIVPELSWAAVHEVFRKIANGERKHGDFLTSFAHTMMMADAENETLLQPAALQLIAKYKLEAYATEPPDPSDGELIRQSAIPPKGA